MATTKTSTENSKAAARRTGTRRRTASAKSASSQSSTPDPAKSDSKVTARAQLDEGNVSLADRLEEKAKDQERRQAQELRDGVATGDEKKAAEAREKRAKVDRASVQAGAAVETGRAPGAQGGLVDQVSARDGHEALTGHFVKIDLNAVGVPGRLVESGRDYGVYLEPAVTDPETGYPVTARVRLRDDTHEVVVVPHAALRRAQAGGR